MAKRAETNVGQWLEAILMRRQDLAQTLAPRLKADQEGTLAYYEVLRIASQLLVRRRFAAGPDEVDIVATLAGIRAVPGILVSDLDRTEEMLRSDLGLHPSFIEEYSPMNWRCRSMLALWSCGYMHMSEKEVSTLVVNAEELARDTGARPGLAKPRGASRLFHGWTSLS